MKEFSISDLGANESKSYSCKGLIVRCRVNKYVSGDKFEFKTTFTKLKRKSCRGSCIEGFPRHICSAEWIMDDLSEGGIEELELPKDLEDFGIYEVVADSYPDGDIMGYRLVKFKEAKK